MKVGLTATGVLAVAGLAVAGYIGWRVVRAAPAVGAAINPLNHDNIFATAGNSVVSALTGRDESLGGWFFDVTHSDPVRHDPTPLTDLGKVPEQDAMFDAMGNRIY